MYIYQLLEDNRLSHCQRVSRAIESADIGFLLARLYFVVEVEYVTEAANCP